MEIYESENLLTRAAGLAQLWEDALHSLQGLPNVIDIRNLGLMGAVEVSPRPSEPGARGYEIFKYCFENGVLVRVTADTVALSPPLTLEAEHIDTIRRIVSDAVKNVA